MRLLCWPCLARIYKALTLKPQEWKLGNCDNCRMRLNVTEVEKEDATGISDKT